MQEFGTEPLNAQNAQGAWATLVVPNVSFLSWSDLPTPKPITKQICTLHPFVWMGGCGGKPNKMAAHTIQSHYNHISTPWPFLASSAVGIGNEQ